MYDCQIHKEETEERLDQFYDPKTLPFFQQNQINSEQNPCSKFCQFSKKQGKKSSINKNSKDIETIINPLQSALINLGVQTFSSDSCRIQFYLNGQYTCQQIADYLIKLDKNNQVSKTQEITNQKILTPEKNIQQIPSSHFFEVSEKTERNSITTEKLVEKYDNITKQTIKNKVFNIYKFEGPCRHHAFDKQSTPCIDCKCALRKYCTKFCLCTPDCPYQRKGCDCVGSCLLNKNCPCFKNSLECDPELCKSCFSTTKNEIIEVQTVQRDIGKNNLNFAEEAKKNKNKSKGRKKQVVSHWQKCQNPFTCQFRNNPKLHPKQSKQVIIIEDSENVEIKTEILQFKPQKDEQIQYQCKTNKFTCQNNQITLKQQKKCVIAPSTICEGLGLFAAEFIPKNSLVLPYIGEEMGEDLHFLRDKWNTEVFYAFTLEHSINQMKQQSVIDSLQFGNKSRFVNHSKFYKNLEPKNQEVEGIINLGLYANQDIQFGQELLFDYDGDDVLYKMDKYSWIKSKQTIKIWGDDQNLFI